MGFDYPTNTKLHLRGAKEIAMKELTKVWTVKGVVSSDEDGDSVKWEKDLTFCDVRDLTFALTHELSEEQLGQVVEISVWWKTTPNF